MEQSNHWIQDKYLPWIQAIANNTIASITINGKVIQVNKINNNNNNEPKRKIKRHKSNKI